jgi:zinc protease
MKRTVKNLIVLLVIVIFAAAQHTWAEVTYHPELFEKLAQNQNAAPQIKNPEYRKMILKNGMVVYLAEDHDFPVVLLGGLIRWGRSQETTETGGISDFMIDMMNMGTRKYNEPELDRYKQLHAVNFRINSGDDNFTFSGNSLSDEKESLVSLAAEMLRRPKFKAKYLRRLKNEWRKSLIQQKTKEDGLLDMYFYRNILKGHAYSFNNDLDLGLAGLDKITPQRLENYYQQSILFMGILRATPWSN